MIVGTPLQDELVDKAKPDDILEYQSMIGSIMYPMIQTCPDICFAVTILLNTIKIPIPNTKQLSNE